MRPTSRWRSSRIHQHPEVRAHLRSERKYNVAADWRPSQVWQVPAENRCRRGAKVKPRSPIFRIERTSYATGSFLQSIKKSCIIGRSVQFVDPTGPTVFLLALLTHIHGPVQAAMSFFPNGPSYRLSALALVDAENFESIGRRLRLETNCIAELTILHESPLVGARSESLPCAPLLIRPVIEYCRCVEVSRREDWVCRRSATHRAVAG